MKHDDKVTLICAAAVAVTVAVALAWPILPSLVSLSDAAVVALVVGGIAASIALAQWRLARERFKLDLFELRYEVYETTFKTIAQAMTTGVGGLFQDLVDNGLPKTRPKTRFVFGPEIEKYVDEVWRNLVALWSIDDAAMRNGNIVRPDHCAQRGEIMAWFNAELAGCCEQRFAPYLDFSRWR